MTAIVGWTAATVAAYVGAQALYRRVRTPLLHPVLVATALTILTLRATGTPYARYALATAGLSFLLIPATASLAVPLFREARNVRRRLGAVVAVIAAASGTTVFSAVVLARAFGCSPGIVASFATKAITTPVALAVSAQIGGIPALAAVFSVLSGVVGALCAGPLLRLVRAWIGGSAMGSVAHGVGTAALASDSDEAAAYSGFAMGANAIASAVLLPLLARLFAIAVCTWLIASSTPAASARGIAFVPLDDRPVTLQLPVMLAKIAGVRIDTPPMPMLGSYLRAGSPDAVTAWINAIAARSDDSFVLSSDMLAYGGLVASRIPESAYAGAYFRLRNLANVRARRPTAAIDVFATIMRLAPTGVPASAAPFFASYPAWTYLQEYANLHDPPLASEKARAAQLRAAIGEPLLTAYLQTRARNLAIDRELIAATARGTIDRLIIGQDDAGPHGLHVREVALLQAEAAGLSDRVSVEPGADELGMAMIASRLASYAHWVPRVEIRYSRPDGGAYQDPLEFAPIAVPAEGLVRACGGMPVTGDPDVVLYVRVPGTTAAFDDALVSSIRGDIAARRPVAVADITFLANTYGPEMQFAQRLLDDGIAGRLDAYASWNTNANTVGTALAEAIAAGAGRRLGRYDAMEHRTFTFVRFLDDVYFHGHVRPVLNQTLDAQGIADHTLLDASTADSIAQLNRVLLWSDAQALLPKLYPGLHIAAMNVTLPWNRTFETGLDVALAPNVGGR